MTTQCLQTLFGVPWGAQSLLLKTLTLQYWASVLGERMGTAGLPQYPLPVR